MQKNAAHDKWWQTSEVVFGIPFLASILLQLLVPLRYPRGILTPIFVTLGVVISIGGVILVILARAEFASHGQRTDPGQPTTDIVSTGVFSFSRNPLYLGVAGFLAGIALAFNLLWELLLLVPSLVACHYILIAPEESYLTAKFGEAYQRYAASVHRWFGRARQI